MSWDDDDFDRQLLEYSEIETLPKEQVDVALPRTIRQYQQKIQSNNSTSIFDADYTLDLAPNDSSSEPSKKVNKKLEDDLGVFKDEKVTYVISGRGRGGRNIVINPGEPNINKVLNGDDEVRQQIRKVAPIGYSNEITEISVRAHKMAKVLDFKDISPNISKSSSPVLSKSSSPVLLKSYSPVTCMSSTCGISKLASEPDKISPSFKNARTRMDLNVVSATPFTASDGARSEYFTSQDHKVSRSSCMSNDKEEYGNADSEESRGDDNSETSANKNQPTGATAKSTGLLSLREILKQNQVARKKKLQGQSDGLSNGHSKQSYDNEVASQHKNDVASQRKDDLPSQRKDNLALQRKIKQDHLDQKRKQDLSDKSSSSSGSSKDDTLPWRRGTNSPTWHPWGQNDRRKKTKELNIDSNEDFPALR